VVARDESALSALYPLLDLVAEAVGVGPLRASLLFLEKVSPCQSGAVAREGLAELVDGVPRIWLCILVAACYAESRGEVDARELEPVLVRGSR
jgi:hypothetical protein